MIAVCTAVTAGFQLDDALIYARYARNLLDGQGLVYNVGERHNAVTSPLFVWLLAVLGAAGLDIPLAANLLGGAATAATAWLLVFRLFPDALWPAGAGAALLLATANLAYLTFGMESPLFLLLLTAALAACRMKRWGRLGLALGLAGATRAEAVFLAAPLYLWLWLRHRRPPWRAVLITAAVVAPFLLYNALYYGRPLPDTLLAKVHQAQSGFWGPPPVFLRGAYDILARWYAGVPAVTVALVLGLPALAGLAPGHRLLDVPGRTAARIGLAAAGLGLGLVTFYAWLPVPAYHWYLLPVVWALAILAPLGGTLLVRLARGAVPLVRQTALAVAVVGFLFVLGAQAWRLRDLPSTPHGPYLRIALWLDANVPPGRSIGLAEVGHVGWYTRLRVVDLAGVVSPGHAAALGAGDVDRWLERERPDYILVHDPPWGMEAGAARALAAGGYGIEPRLVEPGYLLLRSRGAASRAPSSP